MLGPSVSGRQKLSRHLDKDEKAVFILASKREKNAFKQCMCTTPGPTGPCQLCQALMGKLKKATVTIPPTLCKETGLCLNPSG